MNFALLAPWLVTLVALGWILWLTFRQVSNPSMPVKVAGLFAGVMLVLIPVGLATGILPLQIQTPSPVAQKLDTSPNASAASKIFLPVVLSNYAQSDSKASARPKWADIGGGWTMYTVQPGDTLYYIALYHDMGLYHSILYNDGLYEKAREEWVQEVMVANALTDPNNLEPGQEIIVPAMACFVDGAGCGGGLGTMDYVVKEGDTLFSIAKAHNVSVQDIIDANPGRITMDTVLQKDQVLKIPL